MKSCMCKEAETMASNNTKNTAKKVARTVGNVGRIVVGGAMIVGHIALSCIGALLCAITKE